MSATEILNQRQYFSSGYKYKLGGDGTGKSKGGQKLIDCSNLVHCILVGTGYRLPYQTTADLNSSKYFDVIDSDEAKPGDLILWRKVHQHVGILEKCSMNNDDLPTGDFFGSQTSTGPASAKFGTDDLGHKHYWPVPDKFLRPKDCFYHGPGNTKSVDPVVPASAPATAPPKAPAAPATSRKEKLDSAKQNTEAVRAKWEVPVAQEEEPDDGYASKIPMDSGLFPIGVNLTWHGGVHYTGDADGSVHCMFDGTVVAARLPEKDPAKPAFGSRNFVLVQHKTPQGDDFWSLYMHLLPILLKDDDPTMAEALPWLYEMDLSGSEGEVDFRPSPSTGAAFEAPRTVGPGETFVVLDQREAEDRLWYQVQSKSDGTKGWIAKTTRIKTSCSVHELETLKAGKVAKFDHPIKAGTCLGFTSNPDPDKQHFIHLEIFSDKLVSGGWTEIRDDQDNDVVCDADGLKQLMNKSEDVQFLEPLTEDLVRAAYRDEATRAKLWVRAYKFKSEWSVDWEDALKRYDPDVAKIQGPRFNLYRFWDDAISAGCDLPSGGMPYHYQPLVFRDSMFPSAPAEPAPPPASPDGFDVDWDFIASLEGTKTKVYVPEKGGTVIGVSGPTIASGFDLGQIDQKGFDAYVFSQEINSKLSKFIGLKGAIALAFVNNNPCTLTNDQVKEINHKVKPSYARKTEKYYNKAVAAGGILFKSLPRTVQTPFVSVCFQYGKADTLRTKVLVGDYEGAIDTFLHFTTKTETHVHNKKSTNVMQFLPRRIKEAEYMLPVLIGPALEAAQKKISEKRKEWKDATGKEA